MALSFAKIEKIKFGNLEVAPQMTAEQKLRARNLKMEEDNMAEICKVLSECFGDKAAEVREFMEKNLFLMDLVKIKIYLTEGQTGLEALNNRVDRMMDKEMDKLLAAKEAEKAEAND